MKLCPDVSLSFILINKKNPKFHRRIPRCYAGLSWTEITSRVFFFLTSFKVHLLIADVTSATCVSLHKPVLLCRTGQLPLGPSTSQLSNNHRITCSPDWYGNKHSMEENRMALSHLPASNKYNEEARKKNLYIAQVRGASFTCDVALWTVNSIFIETKKRDHIGKKVYVSLQQTQPWGGHKKNLSIWR